MTIYTTRESLVPVRKLLDEAAIAVDESTTTRTSWHLPPIVGGVGGISVGWAAGYGSLTASAAAGTSGAAAITSGFATLGALVGGTMAAGVVLAAAPAAILGLAGYAGISWLRSSQLKSRREAMHQEAVRRLTQLAEILRAENEANRERIERLTALVHRLKAVILDLRPEDA